MIRFSSSIHFVCLTTLFAYVLVPLCVGIGGIAVEDAAAEGQQYDLEKNLRTLEQSAVKTLRQNFPDSLEVRYLIEGYEGADEEEKKVAFDAVWLYVDMTLKPKTASQTAEQKKAFGDFADIAQKHMALRAEADKAK